MNVKEELTCKHCKKIYQDPVILVCCGEHLCKKHIDEIKKNSASNETPCPFCDEHISDQSFKENKIIKNLVENELHEFKIDSKYEKILNELKREIQKFEKILNDPENEIYDTFSELKRLIDLDRESLKTQIDELANEMIDKLEVHEAELKSRSKTKDFLNGFNDLTKSAKKKLMEYEKCLNKFSIKKEERDEKSQDVEELISILQSKLAELKVELLNDTTFSFNPKKEIKNLENLFGKLSIKVSFILNILK